MSGIFDVFTILFQSETEDAEKGVVKLDHNVDELAISANKAGNEMAELGQKSEMAAVVQGKFLDIARQVAGLAAGYFALSSIIGQVGQSINMADQLGEFTESVDGNVESLSAWGDAVKMNGGDMLSFQGSLGSLSAAMVEFSAKGKSRVKPFFDELGISMVDTNGNVKQALDLLPELAKSFEGLSKEQSLAFGKKLGLDGGTVRLLQAGHEEMTKLIERQKKLGVITKEQTQATADFNDAMDDTTHAFRSIYLALAVDILPVFTSVLTAIQDVTIFLREHSGFAIGFFSSIAAVIAAVYLPAIVSAIVATAAMVAPFLPVIAIVGTLATAVGLLYDDFVTWKEGGSSMIGQLMGDFGSFEKQIDAFFEGWGIMIGFVTDHIKAMWNALLSPMDTLGALKDSVADALSPLLDSLPDMDSILSAGRSALSSVNTPLAGLTSAAMGAGQISNNSTVTISKLEVVTQATDAEGVSRDIEKSLTRQLKQTAANYDDGVAY